MLHPQAIQQISYHEAQIQTPLKNCRLWWVGPEWLSQHQEQWHPEPLPEQQEVAAVKVMVQRSPAEFITRFQRYQDYKE